jgi:hypothetical protein
MVTSAISSPTSANVAASPFRSRTRVAGLPPRRLHDGNRVLNGADSSYGARFAIFSSDITRFLDLLRASRRRVVVVFVAENNGTTVIQAGTHFMMRSPDGAWSSLDDGIARG